MTNIMKRNKNGNGALTTTKPVMSLSTLVDDVFQNTLNRFFDDDFWGFNGLLNQNQVPVNIRETDNSFEMEVVAPGLKKEDFNVQVSDDMLTVSFEHKQEDKQENKDEGYLRHEYRQQSFTRSFTLGDAVNADNISAEYRNGVLHLVLPKKEGAQRITKSIQVQ